MANRLFSATIAVSASQALPTTAFVYTVLVNTAAGNVTLTLPTVIGNDQQTYNIKKVSSDNNSVIISPTGSDQIDQSASFSFNTQDYSYQLKADVTNAGVANAWNIQ